jgi:hypothetical protein
MRMLDVECVKKCIANMTTPIYSKGKPIIGLTMCHIRNKTFLVFIYFLFLLCKVTLIEWKDKINNLLFLYSAILFI